ncbi:MAG TPA: hypothetical protein VHR45_02255 [Thermoanaerobaculia bacterium]|nr:hypothetical protein [Thermoanaerobaculia bacterium]
MRTPRLLFAALLGAWLAAPVLADTVYLANGRSFEGVIAEAGDTQVKVQMPGGTITLPRNAVLRIEKSDSSFAAYLRRLEELERASASGAARAADWLELARWARQNGLAQGSREAALQAAEIDPRLPGLAPVLRGFGYVYDEALDRWIPYADSMRRRGFVQDEGQWISREEHAERLRVRDQERRERWAVQAAQAAQAAQTAQAARAARAAELLSAQLQLYQSSVNTGFAYGYGYGFFPTGFFLPSFSARHSMGAGHRLRNSDFAEDLAEQRAFRGLLARPPGSLLPPSAFVPH